MNTNQKFNTILRTITKIAGAVALGFVLFSQPASAYWVYRHPGWYGDRGVVVVRPAVRPYGYYHRGWYDPGWHRGWDRGWHGGWHRW